MTRRAALGLAALLVIAPRARADGQWTTYLALQTCNQIRAVGDTVWVASGEAGVERWVRSLDEWTFFNRQPNGLSGNDVNTIALDRSGNLWASITGVGISRLAPAGTWTLVNAFDGLPSDSVTALRADGDTMWIGTTRGLALWDGHEIAGSIPDIGTPSQFADNRIRGIVASGDTLFVATPAGVYVARLSEHLTPWTLVDAGIVGYVPLALGTDGATVMVYFQAGASVLTTSVWDGVAHQWRGASPPGGVQKLRDDNQQILVTTTTGMYRWQAGTWVALAGAPFEPAVEMAADPTGRVLAFDGGRLLEFDVPTWISHLPPGPVTNDFVNVVSRGGVTYATSFGSGISVLRDGRWYNYPAVGAPCSGGCDTTFTNPNFAFALLVDPQAVWVGEWSGTMDRVLSDPPGASMTHTAVTGDVFSATSHSFDWSAALDSSAGSGQRGRWFGLDTPDANAFPPIGIDLYDENGNWVRNYPPDYPGLESGQVRALAVDRDNQLWVGCASKGVRVAPLTGTLGDTLAFATVDTTLDLFGLAAYGDTIWALATDGLHRIDRRGRRDIARFDLAGAIVPLVAVHPLAVGPDGTVYVGTETGVRVHKRGALPVDITPDNSPLTGAAVRAIYVEPGGVVWIATTNGLNRYDPDYHPPAPPRLPALTLRVWPNPLDVTNLGFAMRLGGNASSYAGEIFDLRGRIVRRFAASGNGQVVWDGFDEDGRRVPPGVYFLRARGDGAEAVARVVVLR